MKKLIHTLFLITYSLMLSAQSKAQHPKFSNFVGDAYSIPNIVVENDKGIRRETFREEYGEWVEEYPKIADIDIPKLKIPESFSYEKQFPGIDLRSQYAMVLESKMTISTDACYEFSLNSDDGSILWIEELLVIDNDGGHQMRLKKDSLVYSPGTYNIKVWYFQGFANKFGIILDAKNVGRPEVCPNPKSEKKPRKLIELEFNNTLFFDSGLHELKSGAREELQKVVNELNNKTIKEVSIFGHTDNVGSESANLTLSQKRAETLATALRELIGRELEIKSIGRGELFPVASNDSSKGRAQNRRVEIKLIVEE